MHTRLRERLDRDGFALVPGVVDVACLRSLLGAVTDALAGPDHPDVLRDALGGVRKITYPLSKDPRFLIELAHPRLLELAAHISPAGEELVLTWEDVLHKPARHGEAVPVHQDLALQSLRGPVYSLGLHLDDASDNPVYFLPGSHRLGPQTRTQVGELRERGGFIPIAPQAGDVLVHNVLCVHYSEANHGPRPRTTWYFEFRTLSQLRAEARWPERCAHQRRALLFHA